MSSPITRETLEHLAKLARIELDPKEEEKLLRDLQAILAYFEELSEIKAEIVEIPIREIAHKNAFREDTEREGTNQGKGTNAFPRTESGFLKIPKVFEN